MDFFTAQSKAKRSTAWLVIMFLLSVLATLVLINAAVLFALNYQTASTAITDDRPFRHLDWQLIGVISVAVVGVMLVSFLYKVYTLGGGGRVVAEMMNGRLIAPHTGDFKEKQLRNVVEEMALASGTAVPPVYIMDNESAINAFAAGLTPDDAVIAVTRGLLDQLDRDQIQGVIAHEFSHILNGDMRLNIRLIGVLSGIAAIAMIGYYLLRAARHGDRKKGGAIAMVGLALAVAGVTGVFFASLIRSSVSRQREYLADASAVQFTRNPQGIAGALKKILGLKEQALLHNPVTAEYGHALFANGIQSFFMSLFPTHPPLKKRIRRIDPAWKPNVQDNGAGARKTENKGHATTPRQTPNGMSAAEVLQYVGRLDQAEMSGIALQRSGGPTELRYAAGEPYAARAVIAAMLLDSQPDVRQKQMQRIAGENEPVLLQLIKKLSPQLTQLDTALRLPLIEQCVGALKTLSQEQYLRFTGLLRALIEADTRVDMFEWSMRELVLRRLDNHFNRQAVFYRKERSLSEATAHSALLLSVVCHYYSADTREAERMYQSQQSALGVTSELLPKSTLGFREFEQAIAQLAACTLQAKKQILTTCIQCARFDQRVTAEEAEFLRALSIALGLPMAPLPLDG